MVAASAWLDAPADSCQLGFCPRSSLLPSEPQPFLEALKPAMDQSWESTKGFCTLAWLALHKGSNHANESAQRRAS
jgi:hypothetical protein